MTMSQYYYRDHVKLHMVLQGVIFIVKMSRIALTRDGDLYGCSNEIPRPWNAKVNSRD